MSNSNQDSLRRIHLLLEIDVSVSTIETGIAILRNNQEVRYFAFLLLLSTGLEHLMKIVLSLHALKISGRFLSNTELKSLSHKLNDLRDRILRECFTQQYLMNPGAQEDFDFLKNDGLLKQTLDILSDFAQRDRYIYLNGINEPEKVGLTPEGRWDKLKDSVARSTEALVICLERFVRALARILTLALRIRRAFILPVFTSF